MAGHRQILISLDEKKCYINIKDNLLYSLQVQKFQSAWQRSICSEIFHKTKTRVMQTHSDATL